MLVKFQKRIDSGNYDDSGPTKSTRKLNLRVMAQQSQGGVQSMEVGGALVTSTHLLNTTPW